MASESASDELPVIRAHQGDQAGVDWRAVGGSPRVFGLVAFGCVFAACRHPCRDTRALPCPARLWRAVCNAVPFRVFITACPVLPHFPRFQLFSGRFHARLLGGVVGTSLGRADCAELWGRFRERNTNDCELRGSSARRFGSLRRKIAERATVR
jgi:hypothetical protein